MKVLSQLFFLKVATGYGSNSLTRYMFELLTETAVALVSTMVYYALKEYSTGGQCLIKFEGHDCVNSE